MFTENEMKLDRFDAVDYLQTEEDIQDYLEAAAQEGDDAHLLRALNTAARARGIAAMSKQIGVNRTSLYKSLDGSVQPTFSTISKALDFLGFRLSIVRK